MGLTSYTAYAILIGLVRKDHVDLGVNTFIPRSGSTHKTITP